MGEEIIIDLQFVSSLLKCDPIYILMFQRRRLIIRVNLDHIIVPLLLLFQDLQRFQLISRSDHPIGNFPLDQSGRIYVTDIGQGNKVPEGRHSVRPSGSGIGARQGRQLSQIIHPVDLCQRIA